MSIESGSQTENVAEKHKGTTFELFSLPEKRRRELIKDIREHKGLIRAFMHPFSEINFDNPTSEQKRLMDIFGRVLSSRQSPPIFVFVDTSKCKELVSAFNSSDIMPQDIFLIPTIDDFGFPILPGKPVPTERRKNGKIRYEDEGYLEQACANFVSLLHKLGVKKILIGGAKLEILEKKYLDRCVGNFIGFIKKIDKNIDIKVSIGTFPLSREDLRKLHPDLV